MERKTGDRSVSHPQLILTTWLIHPFELAGHLDELAVLVELENGIGKGRTRNAIHAT